MSSDRSAFTILGAGGFIGAALVAWLESQDRIVHAVTRASLPALLAGRRTVGHVIDCIGLAADCRECPLQAAEAHVGLVAHCLAELRSDSFLLLSSTRVYAHAAATHENASLPTFPADPSELHNVTKLAGEALCLTDPRPGVRVVRLSDVYGVGIPPRTFLGQLLRDGRETGRIIFRQSPESAADYVNLAAVVRLLPAIATAGRQRIYNVATGCNTSHAAIAGCLRDLTGWRTNFAPDAPTVRHVPIDITRLNSEFRPLAGSLIDDLPALLRTAA